MKVKAYRVRLWNGDWAWVTALCRNASGALMALFSQEVFDHQRGLYGKYRVEKINGKDHGPYFVLAYRHDPHAAVALAAYAESCESEFPFLSTDLRNELAKGAK